MTEFRFKEYSHAALLPFPGKEKTAWALLPPGSPFPNTEYANEIFASKGLCLDSPAASYRVSGCIAKAVADGDFFDAEHLYTAITKRKRWDIFCELQLLTACKTTDFFDKAAIFKQAVETICGIGYDHIKRHSMVYQHQTLSLLKFYEVLELSSISLLEKLAKFILCHFSRFAVWKFILGWCNEKIGNAGKATTYYTDSITALQAAFGGYCPAKDRLIRAAEKKIALPEGTTDLRLQLSCIGQEFMDYRAYRAVQERLQHGTVAESDLPAVTAALRAVEAKVPVLYRLRQRIEHMKDHTVAPGTVCPICLEDDTSQLVPLDCMHLVCWQCYLRLRAEKGLEYCPMHCPS